MKDYFEILQINEKDDLSMIEKAYQDMLVKYPEGRYPDENSNIVKAYEMLTNKSTLASCLNFHRMGHTSKQVYQLADQEIKEGRYNNAIKILDKTIKIEMYNDHLYHLLGYACLGAEKYTKAVKAFDQILTKYSYDTSILIKHAEACIASENFKKLIISSKIGYESAKDNIMFVLLLAKGYVHTRKYKEAEVILKEAMRNPAFEKRRHSICARTAFVLSLESKHIESLEYMEKLVMLDAGEDEKNESGEMLLDTLDYYMENEMYAEADRCMGVIIKLLPDREDLIENKKSIERLLKLDQEFSRLEEDESVPEGLLGLIISELFPEASTGMTQKQKKAYTVMNEYHILYDYSIYLMPLRYIKTMYPCIYDLKKDFFDELQDSKRRRILKTRYQTLVYQYQDTFEELMDEWGEEYEDDDENEDGVDGYEENDEAGALDFMRKKQKPASGISNVRPFVRREDRVGRNDKCPCGSGKKYKNCCGKDK